MWSLYILLISVLFNLKFNVDTCIRETAIEEQKNCYSSFCILTFLTDVVI